jgi:hypothetical protein
VGAESVSRIVRRDDMSEDQFYEIYNRACTENGGPEPLAGDTALTNMLLGHGYIINGGLGHFQDLSEEEQRTSIAGYRFFGFNEVADILMKSPEDVLGSEEPFSKMDSEMMDTLRRFIEAHPQQFRL